MVTKEARSATIQKAISGILFLVLAISGVLAFIFFVKQILGPGDLATLSLPVVALVAGIAATFNPCALPALPGFLAFMGGDDETPGVWRRSRLSVAASLGAMSLVVVLGVLVAFVGTGTKGLIAPYFRWVQLVVGLLLVGLSAMHLMGKTANAPLVGPIMGLGSRLWEQTIGKPTPRGSYLFGAGFVLVGMG